MFKLHLQHSDLFHFRLGQIPYLFNLFSACSSLSIRKNLKTIIIVIVANNIVDAEINRMEMKLLRIDNFQNFFEASEFNESLDRIVYFCTTNTLQSNDEESFKLPMQVRW